MNVFAVSVCAVGVLACISVFCDCVGCVTLCCGCVSLHELLSVCCECQFVL